LAIVIKKFIPTSLPEIENGIKKKKYSRWIKSGKRNSDEVNCPKRSSKHEDSSYENLWTLFNK